MKEFYVIKVEKCPDCQKDEVSNTDIKEEGLSTSDSPKDVCRTCQGTGRELKSYERLSDALKELGFIP